MLETKLLISKAREEARNLDQLLIDGRKPVVGRNLEQIEGRNRSEKYASRLAGISDDVYRKSISERAVEFYGATVLENPQLSELVSEFWQPLLRYPSTQTIYIQRDFFDVDSELMVLFSEVRKAVSKCDQMQARFFAVQAKVKIQELLESIERMPTF